MLEFIEIKSAADLPKKPYKDTHHLYVCILETGKTIICRFDNYTDKKHPYAIWIDPSNKNNLVNNVVAYAKLEVPDQILALCTGNKANGSHVEYFDGLKATNNN